MALDTKGILSDKCGVFVKADAADGGKGTAENPYNSIQEAIASGNGRNVYVCKTAGAAATLTEAVTIQGPITVIGGFDCANAWTYHAMDKSPLTAAPDAIPLTISSAGVKIANLAITSAAAKTAGKSSIAVFASGAEATFDFCDIEAKDGANGADGAAGGPLMGGNVVAATAGPPGTDGTPACSDLDGNGTPDPSLNGGAGASNTCGASPSIGGNGGIGQQLSGNVGSAGQVGALGGGGTGEPVAGGWSCTGAEPNGGGNDGDSGANGGPGLAGKGSGALTATGYQGASGQTGTASTSGQGGGGGGGAKGGLLICAGGTKPGAGASGGGGGAGGCGGGSGEGGTAAGSSIAVASVTSKLTLKNSSLKAGKGGTGGKGGDLQPGGSGGAPGLGKSGSGGSSSSCKGGTGGSGGKGGTGGGGQGGHSIAIAYTGAAMQATQVGKVTLAAGTAGMGGPGGNGSVQLNVGDPGVSQQQQLFP
jgi:hypothetical protein